MYIVKMIPFMRSIQPQLATIEAYVLKKHVWFLLHLLPVRIFTLTGVWTFLEVYVVDFILFVEP